MFYQRLMAKMQAETRMREAYDSEMSALARMNQAHAAMYFTVRNSDATGAECERACEVVQQRMRDVCVAMMEVRRARLCAATTDLVNTNHERASTWRALPPK